MRQSLAILLLLTCALAAVAQRTAETEDDAPALGPPPMINTFEGRPVFRPGGEIKGPSIVSAPEPPPLKDFRAATVWLWCVITVDGKAQMCRVAKNGSTLEANMKAVATVQKWKFKPARNKTGAVDTLIALAVEWR